MSLLGDLIRSLVGQDEETTTTARTVEVTTRTTAEAASTAKTTPATTPTGSNTRSSSITTTDQAADTKTTSSATKAGASTEGTARAVATGTTTSTASETEVTEEVTGATGATGATGITTSTSSSAVAATSAEQTSATTSTSASVIGGAAMIASASSASTSSISASNTAQSSQTSGSASVPASISSTSNPSSTVRAAAAAADSTQDSNNIFIPGHKLFPLGVIVIVLGSLFVLATIGIIALRVFGWNKKRRIRQAIPSFIDVNTRGGNTMFEPGFETITTNIASTNPNRYSDNDTYAGANAPAKRGGSRDYDFEEKAEYVTYPVYEYDAYAGAQFLENRAPPQRSGTCRSRPLPLDADSNPSNPFANPPPSSEGTLGVPKDAGSPVPSFQTDRLAYDVDRPSNTEYAVRAPGRIVTGFSATTGYSETFSEPRDLRVANLIEERAQAVRRVPLDYGGRGRSPSDESERQLWPLGPSSGPSGSNAGQRLGKQAAWGSDRV